MTRCPGTMLAGSAALRAPRRRHPRAAVLAIDVIHSLREGSGVDRGRGGREHGRRGSRADGAWSAVEANAPRLRDGESETGRRRKSPRRRPSSRGPTRPRRARRGPRAVERAAAARPSDGRGMLAVAIRPLLGDIRAPRPRSRAPARRDGAVARSSTRPRRPTTVIPSPRRRARARGRRPAADAVLRRPRCAVQGTGVSAS